MLLCMLLCSSVLCLRLVFLFAVALYVAVYASELRFRVVLLLVLMFSVYVLRCFVVLLCMLWCMLLCVLLFCVSVCRCFVFFCVCFFV